MVPKIFLLGATGYIGGDALFTIVQAHPEIEIACLARDSGKGAQVASQYAKTRLVYGTLDDAELLEKEAKKADIVLNCANADHEGAIKALLKGLASKESHQSSFYVHTSGAFIIATPDLGRRSFGEASSKIFNDWDGIEELLSVPDWAPHHSADKIVFEANKGYVKTAIVCPPTIYGQGRGPSNQRSHQIPDMAKCVLERKSGFQVGNGENRMANVHVHDLSDCYLKLLDAAIDGGGKATWGKEGYYFTENGELVFGQVAKAIASAAYKQGFIPFDGVVTVAEKEANDMANHGAAMWGVNFRYKAVRACKLLGWSPKGESLDLCIAETVSMEAKRLGLVRGHAAKVSQ